MGAMRTDRGPSGPLLVDACDFNFNFQLELAGPTAREEALMIKVVLIEPTAIVEFQDQFSLLFMNCRIASPFGVAPCELGLNAVELSFFAGVYKTWSSR